MSRVQLSINVSDFDAAVAFYARLFGAAARQAAAGLCQLRPRGPAAQAGAELARQQQPSTTWAWVRLGRGRHAR